MIPVWFFVGVLLRCMELIFIGGLGEKWSRICPRWAANCMLRCGGAASCSRWNVLLDIPPGKG